ncbi:MAG TPA: DNA-processing protein DprA [bacterium]|nr:DNA-processing protein DprA [bacterium]
MDENNKKFEITDRRFWIALNQIVGMDPRVFYRLLEAFGNPRDAWLASEGELRDSGVFKPRRREPELALEDDSNGSGEGMLGFMLKLRDREDGSEELSRCDREGFRAIILTDSDYPELLKEIPLPPPVLYVRGRLEPRDARAVAMVGTRRCNNYGRKLARDIASGLARAGVTVVSGFAYGIDAASHEGALAGGGRTIAVKAVGLDVNYPEAHSELGKDIEKSGALISEFPIGTRGGNKWQFHRRNRVISGLSMGVVVVQSREKGGSMITANHALDQGREVFAVPGDVNIPLSGGSHSLIRQGAHLVESAEDILEILGEKVVQEELVFEDVQLDGIQKNVHDILENGPMRLDDMCMRLNMTAREIASCLMMLEMKGLVKQMPGQMYMRN